MSAQTMADAFAPAEARHHAEIIAHTWGHLAPKKNKVYCVQIVWALGAFDCGHLNPTVLQCELKVLDSSPWFYDAMIDFLRNHSQESGAVFRFDGYFKNYQFIGKIIRLKLI